METKVFCGGLPWEADQQDLYEVMRAFGEIEEARVILNHDGKSRGFGFVRFASPKSAAEALRAGTVRIGHRTVYIHKADNQGSLGSQRREPVVSYRS